MAFSKNLVNRLQSALTSVGAATELLNIYNVTTAGTVEASKALVADASKTISGLLGINTGGLATPAGDGVTGGSGTIYKTSVLRTGGIYSVKILIDLTGLGSSTTDLDIIGQGASAAHIGRLSAAEAGTTVLAVRMTCLEAPAGGVTDIDLYGAATGTGIFDGAISGVSGTALITSGGAWSNGTVKAATTAPGATDYLYLTGGAGGTAATYTAGKFLIEVFGY